MNNLNIQALMPQKIVSGGQTDRAQTGSDHGFARSNLIRYGGSRIGAFVLLWPPITFRVNNSKTTSYVALNTYAIVKHQ